MARLFCFPLVVPIRAAGLLVAQQFDSSALPIRGVGTRALAIKGSSTTGLIATVCEFDAWWGCGRRSVRIAWGRGEILHFVQNDSTTVGSTETLRRSGVRG